MHKNGVLNENLGNFSLKILGIYVFLQRNSGFGNGCFGNRYTKGIIRNETSKNTNR